MFNGSGVRNFPGVDVDITLCTLCDMVMVDYFIKQSAAPWTSARSPNAVQPDWDW